MKSILLVYHDFFDAGEHKFLITEAQFCLIVGSILTHFGDFFKAKDREVLKSNSVALSDLEENAARVKSYVVAAYKKSFCTWTMYISTNFPGQARAP